MRVWYSKVRSTDKNDFRSIVEKQYTEDLRDYAILLLGFDTGLRGADIRALCLSDIDWKVGKVKIRQCKTSEPLVLPLSGRVMNVIADYILKGRHECGYKEIFLNIKKPVCPMDKRHYPLRLVSSGSVAQGTTLGKMGNTGQSFGAHLHFETRSHSTTPGVDNNSIPRDPLALFFPNMAFAVSEDLFNRPDAHFDIIMIDTNGLEYTVSHINSMSYDEVSMLDITKESIQAAIDIFGLELINEQLSGKGIESLGFTMLPTGVLESYAD